MQKRSHMKKCLLLNLILFLSLTLSAQIGLIYQHSAQNYNDWNSLLNINNIEVIGNQSSMGDLHTIGLDYSFRPQQVRIEIAPTLSFSRNLIDLQRNSDQQNAELLGLRIAFDLNSQIYLFDLEGDCDCPTFAKSAPFWKKGFYLKLGAGYYLQSLQLSQSLSSTAANTDLSQFNYRGSLGAGLDIGLSESLTISPFYMYVIHGMLDMTPLLIADFFVVSDQTGVNINNSEIGLKISYYFR